jgi:signal transduction histidine kinase
LKFPDSSLSISHPSARGEIRVESKQDAGEAIVTIIDNGVGIPEDLLPKIFDLFAR